MLNIGTKRHYPEKSIPTILLMYLFKFQPHNCAFLSQYPLFSQSVFHELQCPVSTNKPL